MAGRLSPVELKTPTATAKDQPGVVRIGPFGRQFRYVFAKKKVQKWRVVGNRAASVTLANHRGWSAGQSANVFLSAAPLGVAFVQISASQYGYVLAAGPLGNLGGVSCYAITDGGVAAGDMLIKDETAATGRFDTMTNTGTQSAWIMGYANIVDSGSFLASGIIRNVFGVA